MIVFKLVPENFHLGHQISETVFFGEGFFGNSVFLGCFGFEFEFVFGELELVFG